MTPLLSIRNLHVRFAVHGASVDAVRGASFDIPRGATVALVGESGSGKSVIARAMTGLLAPNAAVTGGQIILHDAQNNFGGGNKNNGGKSNGKGNSNDIDILTLAPNSAAMRKLRGGGLSMIFQEPMVSLSALHTIGEQISEALFLHRDVGRSEGMRLTAEMLGTVGFVHPQLAMRLYPFELSGGMRQRAMIAMALICHPALLIADEPTTALDVTIQAQILKLIKRLQKQLDMAVLLITHDLGVVANLADEVVVLYHGEVMERASMQEIFAAPQHPYTRALLAAVPRFSMRRDERLTPLREIHAEVGPFLRDAKRSASLSAERIAQRNAKQQTNDSIESNDSTASNDSTRAPILRVHGLTRSFDVRTGAWSPTAKRDKIYAVKRVDFELQRGECLGLVGESGSGKSTLGKLIARAIEPHGGEILYNGEDGEVRVDALRDAQLFAYRRKVQYIFQDPVGSLNPSMTLFDIIREPMVIHQLGAMDYQTEMCRELMRLVGLDPRHLRRYPHSFSGGQRQRIGIARALALQPDLLICDEPVSALDVSIQAQVLNLMKDLQSELSLSYLFVSHNLAVVDYIADRIAVMYRGELVEMAERASLFERPTHPYTRALLDAIPAPDPARPLNFADIQDPQGDAQPDWPEPFCASQGDDASGALYEIAPGHLVRATADPRAAH